MGCLKHDYENYLRRRRGLSEKTIFDSWRIAERFLQFRLVRRPGSVADCGDRRCRLSGTSDDAEAALRDKTLSSHLRNFFRISLPGRKNFREPDFGCSERRPAIWGEIASAPDRRTSGHPPQGSSHRYRHEPAQLCDDAAHCTLDYERRK